MKTQITEAKKYIIDNANLEGMALTARRDFKRKHPIKWTAHREGGGVVIDSAELDFFNFSDDEIIKYASFMEMSIKLIKSYRNLSLDDFLTQIKPKQR
jgi:hypothetical protein